METSESAALFPVAIFMLFCVGPLLFIFMVTNLVKTSHELAEIDALEDAIIEMARTPTHDDV